MTGRRVWRSLVGATLVCGLLVSCGMDELGVPVVSEARIGQPTGPNAALYFTTMGSGEPDALVSVETDVVSSTQLHETVMGDGGTMSMQPLDSIPVDASDGVVLEPGGYHVMLFDVDRFEVGDIVKLTIIWDRAGPQTIEAEVVEPAETLGDEMGSGG